MASKGQGYDYGTGASGAGGKIRRRPASRAAASPYARPAPVPAPAAASQRGGWFSRLISAGASRLLPSLFRKPPPQLTAPPAPPEPLGDATHSQPEASREPLLLRQDGGPASDQTEPELLDAPSSPRPPPLEDYIPEREESDRAVANVLGSRNSAEDKEEDMITDSDEQSLLDLEDLLKKRTFKRSEFEYLSELLWSRTVGSNSLKLDDGRMKKMHVSEKETGPIRSNLPVDFSIGTYNVSDLVASPAEIAKAYMGSKSVNGSSLRLRLHDPSSLTVKSMEANTLQQARPPIIPIQGSSLQTSKNSDHFKWNSSTPNISCKMSSSPYFKSAVSSDELFSNVPSSCQTPASVHTFGRQVLKRKNTAVNNDMVSVGPIRKMHQRYKYNRTSPLLETRPGYRGHLGCHGSTLNQDSENSAQTQKRRCLSKVGETTPGGLDDKAFVTSFGQAPVQSTEMAAKILKQLDTLVPLQKEVTPEIKQKHKDVVDIETHVSRRSEVSEPSTSGVKENSLLNGINGNATFTPAQVTEKRVDATSNTSSSSTLVSQTTFLKDNPPTFSSKSHPNLVLSDEVYRNKMPITSSGFTFPVPAVLGTQSQAPPTPTMTSPPILPIDKLQPAASSSPSVTTVESGPRIPKSAMEEESIPQKCDEKLNADDQLMSSKSSGQVASFTSKPVFKFANSNSATLTNGLHSSNSNGSISKASVSAQNAFVPSCAGSLSAVTGAAAQSSMSGAGSGSAPFGSFPQFGAANSLATQDKTKVVSSSSTPFNFSQKFGAASSFAAQDKSKAASPGPTMFSGSQHVQTGNNNATFTQDSAHNLSFKPSEKQTGLNSQSLANSPVISAPFGGSFSASSLFSLAASSGSSATATVSAFSAISSSATGSGPAFSASPAFGSGFTTNSPLGSAPNAVFSFTAATTAIPYSSPTTPVADLTTGTGQMNGGNMITERKESPFPTTLPFGTPSNSPSTPIFSSPATQFASTTTVSPEIFKFGEQNASSGAFSIGSGGGTEKSGRKFIRAKRRK